MSQEEEESNQDVIQLSQEELNQEELKQLINRTLKEGNFEAIYILVLNEWRRPGSSFVDYGKFKVLYGNVEIFELDNYYEYPTTNETTYAILPKSRAVILLLEDANDYNGKLEKHMTVYVFTYHKGWQSLNLY